jgi:hypothetical protein
VPPYPTAEDRQQCRQPRAGGGLRRASVAPDGGTGQMAAANPIDEYLATLDEPKRATLTFVRDTIMTIVPDAEQCISYGMPAFKLRGKTIAMRMALAPTPIVSPGAGCWNSGSTRSALRMLRPNRFSIQS